jgi:hypothetical protein
MAVTAAVATARYPVASVWLFKAGAAADWPRNLADRLSDGVALRATTRHSVAYPYHRALRKVIMCAMPAVQSWPNRYASL